jgi:hypothetical protein
MAVKPPPQKIVAKIWIKIYAHQANHWMRDVNWHSQVSSANENLAQRRCGKKDRITNQ